MFSLALELPDPEVDTWKCTSNITKDCLQSVINCLGEGSSLPEKLNHILLLELADLMLKDLPNGFQTGTVYIEEDKERNR
jgi:hypothetical protein